ncbi:hypothetical protein [Brevibacterium jeotgali]|uniref:Uncharacterized protein n=1 Tax=Brevibacterium jeotgali TaxID=1262550 RepID=A0A2H1L3G2_9MICO|nr:hypothetical protein [Brevibacterium jeotgali]TWC01683.1 hypothetical protein FB108_0337 [Brevibacterium jeotgali]SMY11428.1 hypothetical protein BJEO58_01013 [Brevibacterium jeotgali]
MLRFFLAALVALAINLIMDLGFDAPLLLRWAVAILGAVITVQVFMRFTRTREGDPTTGS